MSHPNKSRGITLIELIIALVLLFVIAMGLSNINIFSHFHVLNSDRRAKIQNEASLVLEHMDKEIKSAIGNEKIDGVNSVVKEENVSGDYAIWFYVDDGNPPNGQRDAIGNDDHWIVYRSTITSINPADRYQIWYCPQCANAPCTQCNPAWGSEIIARNIKAFTSIKHTNAIGQLDENSVTVQIAACWDPPTAALPNGTPDNPCVGMNASFQMPSVSIN